MGPLVPDIISQNLNFIVALIIGIFFGAILEQAGFSSTKKLVGLFYGYDFTVLRVFFTAGITAMIGVMALNYYGLLDMNLVYINPTFLWSALIGGTIMGLGFVVGGFCPGTSFCAAAIGKIDAMIFIGGAFLGVLIFGETYALWEPLFKAANGGTPRIFETLGVSQPLFAFLLTAMAVTAFIVTQKIEHRVNKIEIHKLKLTPYYASLLIIGGIVALSSFTFPDRKDELLSESEKASISNVERMSVDEFAYRLMDEYDNKLQIIDFRNEMEVKAFSLPKATLFNIDNLFEKEPKSMLRLKHKINVFIAEDEETAIRYANIANELGYKRIKVLDGGLQKFRTEILEYQPLAHFSNIDEKNTDRFRIKAKELIPVIIEKSKMSAAPVKKEQKRVIGGC